VSRRALSWRRVPAKGVGAALLLVAGALSAGGVHADSSIYKYRDASGNLVYSEQKPESAKTETINITLESKAPRIDVEQVADGEHLELRAINECRCAAEFEVRLLDARNLKLPANAVYHAVLSPQSEQAIVQATHEGDGAPGWRYSWKGVLGTPGAQHRPHEPYRAPFAIGSSFRITQAYPMRFTHDTLDSLYAVDIALPDETPVYAAREGMVINLRHDSFRGAATAVMLDQANMIEILHDDGTIGMYAHLHWDSVRVQPGQYVHRGEYIADSGATGFTTGAHLHFAVLRNAGLQAEAVPIQFTGPGGTAITPQTDMMLTAY
jgi:murein DD-endopeptidase MepM/ murein hydrolase activator NlpD